jgi:hypothetical protein
MDQTLVNGLLAIAGTGVSGALGMATMLVKKHMATLDVMCSNDTKNADTLRDMVSEMRKSNELYVRQESRLTSLEETIADTRTAAVLDQSKEATILLRASMANATGQHAAVTVERPTVPDLDPAPAPPHRLRSAPR